MNLTNVRIETPIYFRGKKEELTALLERLPIELELNNPRGKFGLDIHLGLGRIVYIEPRDGTRITRLITGEGVTIDPERNREEGFTIFYFESQKFSLYYGHRYIQKRITLH